MDLSNPIFVFAGKTLSGKTTLIEILRNKLGIRSFITTTTRPIRPGEIDGVDYFFVNDDQFLEMVSKNEIIAPRSYIPAKETGDKIWRYGIDTKSLSEDKLPIVITGLQGIKDLIKEFGKESVFVFYIHVTKKEQLERLEMRKENHIEEQLRRIEADDVDFQGISQYVNFYISSSHLYNDHISSDIAEAIVSYSETWNNLYRKTN